MKVFGLSLIIVGIIWGIVAFNMDTSVASYSEYYQRVHNFDLADKRRNHLIGAGISLLSGILLFGFSTLRQSTATDKKCPFCAELIKQEATICRYCGKDQPTVSVYESTPLPKIVIQETEPIKIITLEGNQKRWFYIAEIVVGFIFLFLIFGSKF